MTNPTKPLIRPHATKAELQRRLAMVALALRQGMGGAQAIRTAMEMLRVSRRTAQRYVRELQTAASPRAKHAGTLAGEYQKHRATEARKSCANP